MSPLGDKACYFNILLTAGGWPDKTSSICCGVQKRKKKNIAEGGRNAWQMFFLQHTFIN
jgi:hypothetical protein